MNGKGNIILRAFVLAVVLVSTAGVAAAQATRSEREDAEFGPVVRAYLGYLRAQQEVVDDRASRREISRAYYLRNSNRIRALRQMAIRIARETANDYLPELEAVALDEFETLFEPPPPAESLRVGETLDYTFRFLGVARTGREKFYIFARLDPYEQAELRKKGEAQQQRLRQPPASAHTSAESPLQAQPPHVEPTSRPRRVNAP